MPYYRGDYSGVTRGGAFVGDPGFFSFIGRAAKAAAGLVGINLGGATKVIQTVPIAAESGAIRRVGMGAIEKLKRLPLPVKVGGVLAGAAGVQKIMGARPGAEGAAPRGFHVSAKTGKVVRNRRMRVTNPRALRRAIRRANGFARLARRVLHFTSPRRPRGRAVFKKHRRRAA